MRHWLAWIALSAGLLGCGEAEDEEDSSRFKALEEARGRWAAAHLESYNFALTRGCFCPGEFVGPVRVEVVDGVVVARTYVEDGTSVSADLESRFPDVDGLFGLVEEALRSDAAEVIVEYDEVLGAPLRLQVDEDAAAVDDEWGMSVTEPIAATE